MTGIYSFLSWYVFIYPFYVSIVWVILGVYFWWRRERDPNKEKSKWPETWPPVTILVPCYNESASIATTCTSLMMLSYPNYKVLFINDASTDDTAAILERIVRQNKNFHLINLEVNGGKARALNHALATVTSSITVVIDADTLLTPSALKYLVAPFCNQPRLGAVTANPFAIKRKNLLEKIQTAEFSSIISLIKRAQRVVGRVFTVSGCAAAYRTEVLKEVGGFSPYTATEDIDITWRIQRHFYEVWFMPQAVAFIQCPATFKEYWKQRKRWALGGWHLLRTHKGIFKDIRYRYLYPAYLETVLSSFWSFVFVIGSVFWITTYLFALTPMGVSPIPAWLGALLSIACIVQMATSLFINRRYDPTLYRVFFWVPLYIFFYFIISALTTVWTAPKGIFGKLEHVGKWESPIRDTFST